MAGAEAKKTSLAVDEDPKIMAGSLDGLAEHRLGKGKSFDNVAGLKAYLNKLQGMPTPYASLLTFNMA